MRLTRTNMLFLTMIVAAPAFAAQDFDFNIDPAGTWTDGYARVRLWTDGTFKGTFDPVANLLGTRTKVGSGPFLNQTQNDPVPFSPFFEIGHAAIVRTSGTFHLSANTGNSTVTLTNYVADRLPEGDLPLSASMAMNNVIFRTANPNVLYPANVPPQSLGTVHINMLSITQKPGARVGTMTLMPDGSYRVVVNFMADLKVRVTEFGNVTPMTFTVPYSLVGYLKANGISATFGYSKGLGGESFVRDVNVVIPTFPIQFDAGIAANASFNVSTTVKTLGIQISGMRQMVASTSP